MQLETNFNIAPYYDDHDPKKNYYKVLFKPGLSVQNRELHQVQDMSQDQIERFADNIFKTGTIVEGCNFSFNNSYPYVKLTDNTVDGVTVIPNDLVSYYIKSSNTNLTAYISDGEDGFESTPPDLKTVYVKYINSGDSGEAAAFTPGETLTVYSTDNRIFSANVIAGSTGFSNSDNLIFVPAFLANVSTGTVANGDYIINPLTGANVQVVLADYSSYANINKVLLKIKPRAADLANASVNSIAWTIKQFDSLTNPSNTVSVYVEKILGTGAQGEIITNGIGKVTEIVITNGGADYIEVPHATIQSANNLSGINGLTLDAKNYHSQVKVAANGDSVGYGYAFTVSEGIIYQKGYMVKVNPQSIIVDKYSPSPNNVVAGFKTVESIVTANEDESLFDNAVTGNKNAPGADRLRLTPELVVLDIAEAVSNTLFNPLVEWSDGQPFKQNQHTQYSRLGDEMAQRTFDESGNYVIDTFQIATASTANTLNDAKYYTCVVDPGQAYISGFKVQTLRNFYIDVSKGLDTQTSNNIISLNYGSYVRVKEIGGVFQFSTADTVDLYDTAKSFLSNTSLIVSGNTSPVGNKIGTARLRSLVNQSGVPGDPNAIYNLYLFDIRMNKGFNFDSTRSFYYNGSSNKGICDVVITTTMTGANVAQLENRDYEKLLFPSGVESVKVTANSTYTYRTIDQTTAFSNNGTLTKSIAASPNEFYPYTGNLSSSQLSELMVIPVGNNLMQYTTLTGTVAVNTTSNLVVGTGTSFFNDFNPGDYLYANGGVTNTAIKKVTSIINSTALTVDSTFLFTASGVEFKRTFPKNVPMPFGQRTGLTANVNSNGNIINLGLAHSNGLALTLEGSSTVNTAFAVNIKRTNINSTSKTSNRKRYVKICCGNNEGGTTGPWPIGVPDAFRLRNVYIGNSTVNTTSGTKIGGYFYIDHNQNQNFYDMSWLYRAPKINYTLANTDYLLVEFDYFTRASEGYFDTVSYLNTSNAEQIASLDATPLANLTSSATSYEIPEIYTGKGDYYDLINCLDFRPAISNTVAPTTDANTAPLNPSSTLSFGNTTNPLNDKKFPLPDSSMVTTLTQYLGRVDCVYISGEKGDIYILKGIPAADPRKRYDSNHPKESLKLQTISVPPYPNITNSLSSNITTLLRTGIANERFAGIRWKSKVISPILSSYEFQLSQPMVYTMEDIAQLERRIKDLEYYVSLSILETSITNKIIPSSIDRSLNRFKFGFFADDFSTEFYSDTENPQYAASIETEGDLSYGISKSPLETDTNWANADKASPESKLLSPSKLVQKSTNRLVPPKFIWSMPHVIDNIPYVDQLIISQDYATIETEPTVEECVPVTETVYTPSSNGYVYVKTDGAAIKTTTISASSKAGTVKLYFDNKETYTRISVYKNGSIITNTDSSANSVSNLTTDEKAFLQNNKATTGFILETGDYVRLNNTVKNSGKLSWTHNPTTGLDYVVVVEQSGNDWEYLFEYPLSETTTTKTVVDPCKIIKTETGIKLTSPGNQPYIGTIEIDQTQGTAWSCSKRFAINNVRLTGLFVRAYGLKPNTIHKFYVDGIDQSSTCEPLPYTNYGGTNGWNSYNDLYSNNLNNYGKNLISNPEGKLVFAYALPIATDFTAETSWFNQIVTQANKTSFGSSGYSTFVLAATNSVATKLVALRTAGAKLPTTPAGNP